MPNKKLKIKNLVVVISVITIAGIIVFYMATNDTQINSDYANSTLVGQNLSQELSQQISNVDYSTISLVGSGTALHFNQISGDQIIASKKPVVLYVGADYCPYCAAERWALVVALSKFGTFSNLSYMLSSPTDVYPNTPTISFHGSTFTSKYLDFQSVELQDRSGSTLETLTPEQQNIFSIYGQNGAIPFVDIANQYVFTGSQFVPSALAGLSWSQVGAEINDPNSDVARGVDSAANIIISDICKSTNYNPTDACSRSFVKPDS